MTTVGSRTCHATGRALSAEAKRLNLCGITLTLHVLCKLRQAGSRGHVVTMVGLQMTASKIRRDVRFWHKADVTRTRRGVRFRGKADMRLTGSQTTLHSTA